MNVLLLCNSVSVLLWDNVLCHFFLFTSLATSLNILQYLHTILQVLKYWLLGIKLVIDG
jgi:hypothetical protein